MVLIGLIIIAVVLMVLGVPGVQWKLLVPTAGRASRTTICRRPAHD